ncbi:MAG: DUF6282 family protein, partial [Elusimicrobiota bacterium]|nr:DUF6282 family protein [Elusimicrobiota bacterium]
FMMQNEVLSAQIEELITQAIDTHVHSAPSYFPRLFDDLQLRQDILNSPMTGVVLKSHGQATPERAYIGNKLAGREVFFGSITLNLFNGGINPIAVEGELLMGAKIVWFPTIHAANHIKFYGGSNYKNMKTTHTLPEIKEGIKIIDKDGKLLPEVDEVLKAVKKYDACVATGHMSIEESVLLCRRALALGIKKVVLTHPDFETQRVPVALQSELAKEGVFIEKTALNVRWKSITMADMAKSILEIGSAHCIISTDYGQVTSLPIPQGMREYVADLLNNGIAKEDIEIMLKKNPRKILGFKGD